MHVLHRDGPFHEKASPSGEGAQGSEDATRCTPDRRKWVADLKPSQPHLVGVASPRLSACSNAGSRLSPVRGSRSAISVPLQLRHTLAQPFDEFGSRWGNGWN